MRPFIGMVTLLLIVLFPSAVAQSQSSENWVSVITVRDLTGNVAVSSGDPLLSGHAYNVTISISVPFNQTSSIFQVQLDSAMQMREAQYWFVQTPRYGGYNASTFTPSYRSVAFTQIEGTLVMSGIFTIPVDFTVAKLGGINIHSPLENFSIVTVTVTGGSKVGKAAFTMSDQAIQDYLNSYSQKSTLIPSGKINQAYIMVVNPLLQQAQSLYRQGLVEQSTSLLGTIDPAFFPPPPDPILIMVLTATSISLAGLTGLIIVMLLRSRSRLGFISVTTEGVGREIAALEVKAARYDTDLSDDLKRLRDRLGEVR